MFNSNKKVRDILLGIAIILSLFSCSNSYEVIQGDWVIDFEKTIAELEGAQGVPTKIINCYRQKICGLTQYRFIKDELITRVINSDGKELSVEKYNYEILENNKGQVSIHVIESGETYTAIFTKPSMFYIVLEVDGYSFKEYYFQAKTEKN